MASTYSTNLALELIGTGDQSGTWGTTTNTNLGTLIEQAISGYVTQAITDGADTTITIPNGATGVARNMYIEMTGALTAARNLIVPANKKLYFVFNNTTGGYAVTVKVSGLTGISVPNGVKVVLVSNGTDVVAAATYLTSLSLGTVLTVANGGTGVATLTGVVKGNGTSAFSAAAAGTDYLAPPSGTAIMKANSGGALANATAGTDYAKPDTASTWSGIQTLDDGKLKMNGATSGTITVKAPAVASTYTITYPAATTTLGYVNLPAVGTKTGSYTLATADIGKYVQVGSGGSITIPDATFAEGDAVSIFNNTSGNITITCTITTAYIAGTDSDKATMTLATRGVATILFISSTICVVTGNVS